MFKFAESETAENFYVYVVDDKFYTFSVECDGSEDCYCGDWIDWGNDIENAEILVEKQIRVKDALQNIEEYKDLKDIPVSAWMSRKSTEYIEFSEMWSTFTENAKLTKFDVIYSQRTKNIEIEKLKNECSKTFYNVDFLDEQSAREELDKLLESIIELERKYSYNSHLKNEVFKTREDLCKRFQELRHQKQIKNVEIFFEWLKETGERLSIKKDNEMRGTEKELFEMFEKHNIKDIDNLSGLFRVTRY